MSGQYRTGTVWLVHVPSYCTTAGFFSRLDPIEKQFVVRIRSDQINNLFSLQRRPAIFTRHFFPHPQTTSTSLPLPLSRTRTSTNIFECIAHITIAPLIFGPSSSKGLRAHPETLPREYTIKPPFSLLKQGHLDPR